MIYNIEDYCKRLGNRKTIAEYNIKATAYEFNKKIGMLMALYYNTNIDKDEYNKKLADYLKYYKIIPVNKTTIRDNEFLKNYKYDEVYMIVDGDKDIHISYVLLDSSGEFLSTNLNNIYVKTRKGIKKKKKKENV
jgi:hypothetical protein